MYISPMKKIVKPLLAWYAVNARELPWRSDPSPYHVWLSEIMLQQTRVDTVIPYYKRFLEEVPTVETLADIPEERLLKLWEGLGYYSRARNLQKAAKQIAGRTFPATFDEIRRLPGVGDYTAGAIASIAFGLPEPAVDGNVLRVLSRVRGSRRDITEPKLKEEFRRDLREIYPPEQCSEFTQALMELGATVCYPNGVPDCSRCPWQAFCVCRQEGSWREIPVKSSAKARKIEKRIVQIALCNGKVALRKRPSKGLLANLWEFPHILEGEELPVAGETTTVVLQTKHIFSHLEWHMSAVITHVPEPVNGFEWVQTDELEKEYALPAAFNAFKALLKK